MGCNASKIKEVVVENVEKHDLISKAAEQIENKVYKGNF